MSGPGAMTVGTPGRSAEEWYRKELNNSILPFWLDHAPDRQNGGHFTCIDRDGSIYDTDKYLWMQSRLVWTTSKLAGDATHRIVEKRFRDTLAAEALRGAEFLLRYGRDDSGKWYFSLRRDGRPATAPYNIFTDCFACMALSEYGTLSGSKDATQVAVETWNSIQRRLESGPKGKWEKRLPTARAFMPLNVPMIQLNLAIALLSTPTGDAIGSDTLLTVGAAAIHRILELHFDPNRRVLRERVPYEVRDADSMEGRLFTPGHALETIGFLLQFLENPEAATAIERNNDGLNSAVESIRSTATDLAAAVLERSWDTEYNGLFYFLDLDDRPPVKLEWSMKLWWVHVESALTALRAYLQTGDQRMKEWYLRIHDYMVSHFPDPDHGEWFGYLNRDGTPSNYLKGGPWKGMFHLPRGLYEMAQLLQESDNQ